MNKNKTEIKKVAKNMKKEDYMKKITFSYADGESLDLLDIIESFLCKSLVKL